jgi:ubiquinone/menaquinone biosynthesis C-methylase UbiE
MDKDTTRLYYEQNADSYADATRGANLQPVWDAMTSRLPPGALILDLGCGSGRDLRYFAKQGLRVIGMDYASSQVKKAIAFSGQQVVLANIMRLPFSDGAFSGVWAIASLLHISRVNALDGLMQVYRVLEPQGVFVASMKKGHGSLIDRHGRYFENYSPDEWTAMLQVAGFLVDDLKEMQVTHSENVDNSPHQPWLVSVCRKKR